MIIKSVVFDLYGTLFDVNSVEIACEQTFPSYGAKISDMWRRKQIEYSWLRSVMDDYRNFEELTEDALRYTCDYFGLELRAQTAVWLCDAYMRISPHADAMPAIARLYKARVPMSIVSNGTRRSINSVIRNASLEWAFEEVISVEELEIFKPHPSVYTLAEQRIKHSRENILFVSSNAWDAAAAKHFGFPTCWNNRKAVPFDLVGTPPTFITNHLGQMADLAIDLFG